MERVQICCLKGVGPSTKKFKIIPLEDRDEVTIGRADDCTVSIISNMISRKHAIIKKTTNGERTITDNKSLNGIFINDKRLEVMVPHTLSDGDIVQLGVKVSAEKSAEFVWKFFSQLSVKKIKKTVGGLDREDSVNSLESSEPFVLSQKQNTSNRKRRSDENEPGGLSRLSPSKNPCKRARVIDSPKWSPTTDMQRKLKEQEEKAREQLREQQEKLAEMQRLLAERDAAQEKMAEELSKKEAEMQEELRKQQLNLEAQHKKYEEEVKRNYEEQIKDREDCLVARLEEEKNQLLDEKRRIEQSLQTEMARKLGEKDKDYQDRLQSEKDKLDKVIKQKEIHQKLLETQLNETKTENVKQKESMLHAKEDILSNFTELIETELQCSICSEMFVQATSLNCSHSFCAACIEQWMKVKKECPVCRAAITSHIRSIVLDSYIDRMVEHLSEDMKAKRQELVAERKAEKAKQEEAKVAASTSGRGRGRGRGARRGGGRAPAVPEVAAGVSRVTTRRQAAETVVVSSDNEPEVEDVAEYMELGSSFSGSESSNSLSYEESDEDSEVEGVGGAYFGGYGECYRCGSRGHWANGCPF